MKIGEYEQMMSYLTRPAAETRENFAEGTKTKLVEFVKNFVEKNNRPPTIMEVADGAKSSTASIRKYLEEGVDFVKTLVDQGIDSEVLKAAMEYDEKLTEAITIVLEDEADDAYGDDDDNWRED